MTDVPDQPNKRNYWEVYTPDSWLNFMTKAPYDPGRDPFIYFGYMSESMARHCGGTGEFLPGVGEENISLSPSRILSCLFSMPAS